MEKYSHLKLQEDDQDGTSSQLKRNRIVALHKMEFDFEKSHLPPVPEKESGLLSKCFSYNSMAQARDLGQYPFFREIEETEGCRVVINGKKVITVCTNNYLGLG